MCFDFDHPHFFDYLRGQHPEWFVEGTFLVVATAKGYHLIWFRSKFCDDLPLTDKSRALEPSKFPREYLDKHGEVPLDVKTISSTGTSGVLAVGQRRWVGQSPLDINT